MNRSRPNHSRSGYSLVEMLTVVTIISVLFGVMGMTMHRLARADRNLRSRWDRELNLDRLAIRFRTDAHLADSVQVTEDDPQELVCSFDGLRVVYRADEGSVSREVSRQGNLEHREKFYMRPADRFAWSVDTRQDTSIASLIILGKPVLQANGGKSSGKRIDAAVGVVPRTLKLENRPSSEATNE